jgi:cardiolipin synthase (CMP-forming)
MTAADWLSCARLAMAAGTWPLALAGHGRLVGIALIAAGLTDALDGWVARRSGQTSARGARLDAVADTALLMSAGCWLTILHPEVIRTEGVPIAATAVVYAVSLCAGWAAFRRLADPRQMSSKVAGALLYVFALFTMLTGAYVPALLTIALFALAVSSAETILAAVRTIHVNAIVSKMRSHAPQALNEVASSPSPIPSVASSAAPSTSETRRYAGSSRNGAATSPSTATPDATRCHVVETVEAGSRWIAAAARNPKPAMLKARRPATRSTAIASAQQATAINAIARSTATAAGMPGTARRLIVRDIGS